MHNYSFRSESTDCFCYATKQTYYSGEPDPETPQQLRWPLYNNCEQLKTVDYHRKVLHLSCGRVHGSASDNE